MTDSLKLHLQAIHHFGELVHAVPSDGWHRSTPCADWDVRELVNHVTAEQLWAPALLSGRTVDEVGDVYDGDVLGDDPVAAWDSAAAAARAAWTAQDALGRTVHLSGGDTPARGYLDEMTMDLAVHGWDLARGIGADDSMDPDVVDVLLTEWEPRRAKMRRSGMFGGEVDVAADADPQTRLLALFGRRR